MKKEDYYGHFIMPTFFVLMLLVTAALVEWCLGQPEAVIESLMKAYVEHPAVMR